MIERGKSDHLRAEELRRQLTDTLRPSDPVTVSPEELAEELDNDFLQVELSDPRFVSDLESFYLQLAGNGMKSSPSTLTARYGIEVMMNQRFVPAALELAENGDGDRFVKLDTVAQGVRDTLIIIPMAEAGLQNALDSRSEQVYEAVSEHETTEESLNHTLRYRSASRKAALFVLESEDATGRQLISERVKQLTGKESRLGRLGAASLRPDNDPIYYHGGALLGERLYKAVFPYAEAISSKHFKHQ